MDLAQFPATEQEINSLLTEPNRLKEYARELVEKYVSDPQNGFGGELHRGMDVMAQDVRFETEKRKFVQDASEPEATSTEVLKTGDEVKAEEEKFLAAMKDYEDKVKDKYKTGIDFDEVHTMEQVWEAVEEAIANYQIEDVKGFWGRIRKAFRKLGEHNKALEGWMGLLPTESHYLSSVCGGLKLILKAAGRLNDVREEVLQTLLDIPTILNGVQRVLVVHKDSDKLQTYSSAIYVSTLHVMGHMLEYLRRKCISKVWKAFYQQSSFELALDEKVNEMKRSRDAFNNEATLCSQEMLKKVQDVSQRTEENSRDTLQGIEAIKGFLSLAVQEQVRVQLIVRKGLKADDDRFNALFHGQSELEDKMCALTTLLKSAVQMFMGSPTTADEAYLRTRRLDAPHPSMALSAHGTAQLMVQNTKKSAKKAISPSDLRNIILSRLSYDESALTADTAANYTLAFTLCPEDQDRCIHIIRSAALAAWINTPVSAPLIINGNTPKAQRQSPLSFICAKLVHTFSQLRDQGGKSTRDALICVHFFCGAHLDRSGPKWQRERNSPVGIANSLLAQLLQSCSKRVVDLVPIIKLGDFDGNNLRAICERFEALIKQLPRETVVFCIIDGLSFFLDDDDEKVMREAEKLFQWLVWLTRKTSEQKSGSGRRKKSSRDEGASFKVLVTAPVRLHAGSYADDCLEDKEVLDVPMRVLKTGGFTELKWLEGVGGSLGELI